MTTPEVQTIERNGSRLYVDPVSGVKVPSVTFVLGHDPEPMSLSCSLCRRFLYREGWEPGPGFCRAPPGLAHNIRMCGLWTHHPGTSNC
jgi:hypothetical protein